MKNLNRTFYYWLLQFLGWSSYAILVLIASFNKQGYNLGIFFFINLVVSLLLGIYLSHQLKKTITSKGLLKINQFTELLQIVSLVLIFSFLHALITKLISLSIIASFLNFSVVSFLLNWASIFLIFGFWLALYYGIHLFEQIQRQEYENLRLKATQTELELQNLRSQLNPHFLFNALNSTRALVEVDPKKSKEAITLLSNLLRFSLSTSLDRLITIESELQMVDSYLRLEKIRFEERLTIKKEISEEVKLFKIPAFAIQTLVENAIKHGISKLINGGEVIIRVDKNDRQIFIQVSNSGMLGGEKDLGIGLTNLCKRLEIEYNQNFKFSIFEDKFVFVEIQIPANR
jgi:two-component system LytT family sensor kinase